MSDGEISVVAAVGGRRLTLDPIRVIPTVLEVREVESTIPCGFQSMWGESDDPPTELTSGAGMGSRWGTIRYKDRSFCFDATQLMVAFMEAEKGGPGKGELGISFNEVGSVAQSLGVAAHERENVTREEVIAYMTGPEYDEDELWTVLGPLIDKIEDAVLASKEVTPE